MVVIIYESRPNVTADAASLCFKSGNATILRGGKEALNSNLLIAQIMIDAGKKSLAHFPAHAIQVVPTTDREAVPILLSLTQYIDLCMPRGGESLIRAVADCSKVPVIKHYKGVCHVFVDAGADLKMAEEIAMNAKVQRPAVCNAMETLLVDQAVAEQFLPVIGEKQFEKHVEIRGCWGCDYSHVHRAVQILANQGLALPWADSITAKFGIDQANEALAAVENRTVIKALIVP